MSDDFSWLKLTEPPFPRSADNQLRPAIRDACEIACDIPRGRAIVAVDLAAAVTERGHTLRASSWAIYELVKQTALQLEPRAKIDVIQIEEGGTIETAEDGQQRHNDGRLIHDPYGPYPLKRDQPAAWHQVVAIPVYERLDAIAGDKDAVDLRIGFAEPPSDEIKSARRAIRRHLLYSQPLNNWISAGTLFKAINVNGQRHVLSAFRWALQSLLDSGLVEVQACLTSLPGLRDADGSWLVELESHRPPIPRGKPVDLSWIELRATSKLEVEEAGKIQPTSTGTPQRTTLRRLQEQFEAAAKSHPGIKLWMIHADGDDPKKATDLRSELWHKKPKEDTPEGGCHYGKSGAIRSYWFDHDAAGVTRFLMLANQVVPCLNTRTLREYGVCEDSLSSRGAFCWIWCLFDLAWQRRTGTPLKAIKQSWNHPSGTLYPYDRSDPNAPKLADWPPKHYFSELPDVFLASVYAIDILLSDGDNETIDLAPNEPAKPVKKKRKRGRPKGDVKRDLTADRELVSRWLAARAAGIGKPEFCKDEGIKVKELEAAQRNVNRHK